MFHQIDITKHHHITSSNRVVAKEAPHQPTINQEGDFPQEWMACERANQL